MPDRAGRRRRLAVVLTGAVLSLAACGDDATTPPTIDEEPPAVWNPCAGLAKPAMERAFGVGFTKEAGEPTAPRCTFTPTVVGGPALDANYMLFPAGLDAAWDSMGTLAGEVEEVDVAGADDARLVVKFAQGSLLVTGFVQNGDLIQIVNLVDPAPHDRTVDVAGVRTVLAAMSAHAGHKGLS
ncbi:MAG: hypothetical protein Q7J48_04455 [Nocardioides sp.]|nr:hypothetical protein [Nocardioides sp.]